VNIIEAKDGLYWFYFLSGDALILKEGLCLTTLAHFLKNGFKQEYLERKIYSGNEQTKEHSSRLQYEEEKCTN